VIHGRDDTLVPVGEAQAFVERLRAVSTSPVVYAEVHGAQHAFDLFPSVRSAHIVGAVERFLLWARSESQVTRHDGADAVSSPDGAGNMSASGTSS
jgi:acetyl esterase/lipase